MCQDLTNLKSCIKNVGSSVRMQAQALSGLPRPSNWFFPPTTLPPPRSNKDLLMTILYQCPYDNQQYNRFMSIQRYMTNIHDTYQFFLQQAIFGQLKFVSALNVQLFDLKYNFSTKISGMTQLNI